jgi:hypothetical protein
MNAASLRTESCACRRPDLLGFDVWTRLFGSSAVMAAFAIDPWLCVPTFRWVCQYRSFVEQVVNSREAGMQRITRNRSVVSKWSQSTIIFVPLQSRVGLDWMGKVLISRGKSSDTLRGRTLRSRQEASHVTCFSTRICHANPARAHSPTQEAGSTAPIRAQWHRRQGRHSRVCPAAALPERGRCRMSWD